MFAAGALALPGSIRSGLNTRAHGLRRPAGRPERLESRDDVEQLLVDAALAHPVAAARQVALQLPDIVEGLAKNSRQPAAQPSEGFARMVRHGMERWAAIAKATGFTTEYRPRWNCI